MTYYLVDIDGEHEVVSGDGVLEVQRSHPAREIFIRAADGDWYQWRNGAFFAFLHDPRGMSWEELLSERAKR